MSDKDHKGSVGTKAHNIKAISDMKQFSLACLGPTTSIQSVCQEFPVHILPHQAEVVAKSDAA